MFLLIMFTMIISLLWSVQLFVPIPESPVTICLNLAMIAIWITLTVVFCHKQICPRKPKSKLLEVLIQV
jgi:hypothetical protein